MKEIRSKPENRVTQKPSERKRGIKEMDKLFNQVSIIVGLLGGVCTYFLGGWDELLRTILYLAIADYATGWIKAFYLKKLSSEIGFRGLLKKIVMFIVIATAFEIQNLIGGKIPLREVVIMFYIANEGLSLLENVAMFVPVPDALKNALLQLREKDTDSEGESEGE